MKSKTRRIILAVAVIGALAAGGAAFTDTNGFTGTSIAGYGTQTVSGAVISNTSYVLSTDGTTITEVDLTFNSDQTGNIVKAGFGAVSVPHPVLDIPCVVTLAAAVCTGGPSMPVTTATAENFAVAVTNDTSH